MFIDNIVTEQTLEFKPCSWCNRMRTNLKVCHIWLIFGGSRVAPGQSGPGPRYKMVPGRSGAPNTLTFSTFLTRTDPLHIFSKYENYYTSSIQLVPKEFFEGLFSSEFRFVVRAELGSARTQREIQKKKTLKKLF